VTSIVVHSLPASPSIGDDRLSSVTDDHTAEPAGGEQAANTLQPDDTSRHTTTANAKVRGAIEAFRLVTS
jgi:hypothetical protein